VVIGTNPPARPSRLYQGIGSYLRKSVVTIFRIYTLYKPLKTFFLIGALLLLAGSLIGGRFVYYFVTERSAGHVQSLILAAVLLIAGFQTMLIGLLADLISVNRRLSEDILIRLKKLEQPPSAARPAGRRDRDPRSEVARSASERPAPKPVETQWVWLVDEAKLDAEDVPVRPPAPPEPEEGEASRSRRRRRRRGPRHFSEAREHHPRVPKNDGGNDDASS
jgi:hypothetical protein